MKNINDNFRDESYSWLNEEIQIKDLDLRITLVIFWNWAGDSVSLRETEKGLHYTLFYV